MNNPEQLLPTKQEILDYLASHNAPILQRDLGKALHVSMSSKHDFRELLKSMIEKGQIERGMGKKISAKGLLNEVCTLNITHTDNDGELIAVAEGTEKNSASPLIHVENHGAPKVGDRILARLSKQDANVYSAKLIRVLSDDSKTVLGILQSAKGGFMLDNADKKDRNDYFIATQDSMDCEDGDMVLVVQLGRGKNRVRNVKVTERIGKISDADSYSLLSIYKFDIPNKFPDAVVKETDNMVVPPLGNRTDLRHIPLVTIDGSDARDFDDAVYCEKLDNGGFKLLVAIADVSHYVTIKSALDDNAEERGNSVYFPDRVVPMLPEKLSNRLCSLVPNEERACMAVWMDIDKEGNMTGYKFIRGLMRSHARLTYEQVQTAYNGNPCELTVNYMNEINNLYKSFEVLLQSRERRGTLELELPERQVIMNKKGRITSIVPRIRLDSHKLIEEFMISANVASAKALEKKKSPAIMYRVHDVPLTEKVNALQTSLREMDMSIPTDGSLQPRHFTQILRKVKGTQDANLISDLVLRSQSQAVYSPDNLGHFGLALTHYAHFTSPIRRYSDLLVHRALISAYGFGDDGLNDKDIARFESIAEHISTTERRASKAEREAMDRYVAHFMQDKVGAQFTARINGVTGFAMFINLEETGADGIIFLKNIPGDYFAHDEATSSAIGVRKGMTYRMGDVITVELLNISPVKGAMEFAITSGGTKGEVPQHLKQQKERYGNGGGFSRGNDRPSRSKFKKPTVRNNKEIELSSHEQPSSDKTGDSKPKKKKLFGRTEATTINSKKTKKRKRKRRIKAKNNTNL